MYAKDTWIIILVLARLSDLTDGNSVCTLNIPDDQKADKLQEINMYTGHVKQIEYHITIHNQTSHDDEIWPNRTVNYYKIYDWKRVFSRHGQALLSLPFTYKWLSFTLLSYGVEAVNVELQDFPSGCFQHLSQDDKVATLQELVLYNFKIPDKNDSGFYLSEANYACHMTVQDESNILEFGHTCCTRNKRNRDGYCYDHEDGYWFDLLFKTTYWIDVVFFLFFPLFALNYLSRGSYRTTNYIIKLLEPDIVTFKKVKNGEDKETAEDNNKKCDNTEIEMQPLKGTESKDSKSMKSGVAQQHIRKCNRNLPKIPLNEPTKVSMPLIHILVDHTQLMAENEIQIGFLDFFWSNLVLCNIRKGYPFYLCCKQSIFGSWETKFYCMNISNKYDVVNVMRKLNNMAKKHLSWNNLFQMFSALLIVFLILTPFYIQTLLYYYLTEDELECRESVSNILGVPLNPPAYLPHIYFIPNSTSHICILVVYFLTSIILLITYQNDRFAFVRYLVGILRDFKHLQRLEIFKMMALHFITPFEKFGIFGIFVAPFSWLITLTFAIVTTIFYCIPTIYISGRLLFLRKPGFVHSLMGKTKTHNLTYQQSQRDDRELLHQNIDSKEAKEQELDTIGKVLQLDRISPKSDDLLMDDLDEKRHISSNFASYNDCKQVFIGIVLWFWMVSVLIIYADFFGVLVEMLTLTFMGAIANASSVGQYFFFVFFVITYAKTVLNKVNKKYQVLASELFTHIKSKLDDQINDAVIIFGPDQKNIAFKFFSKKEIREIHEKRMNSILYDGCDVPLREHKDTFARIDKKLYHNLHSIILFLDKNDIPRIPKKLFDKVCDIECQGSPGPVYKNLLIALRELGYLVLFLFFVMVVVMAFSDVYEISTTNQLLLTVIGGFAPFIIRFVITPKELHVNFSTYAFKGKVHDIISVYREYWPVYDIEFKPYDGDNNNGTENGRESGANTKTNSAESLTNLQTYTEDESNQRIKLKRTKRATSHHQSIDAEVVEEARTGPQERTSIEKPKVDDKSTNRGSGINNLEHVELGSGNNNEEKIQQHFALEEFNTVKVNEDGVDIIFYIGNEGRSSKNFFI